VGTEDASFDALIDYIKSNRGFDFTGYKRPSLERRIQRRMQEHRLESYDEYRTYLDEHPDEFVDLFNTILINVTAFFRDVPAWEYVRAEIVPRIVEESQDRGGIRVWSTGCASGEEAYTLAIAFAEALSGGSFAERVKIYATDVDEEALSEGRHGIYPAARVENVPADLRERYFEHVDDRYVVKPELRRGVIFGRHDIVQDPPISRIDLLASRNTLMYFKKEAQARILANFHFALRGGGYLFLGKSEMMLARSDLFHPVDVKRRVFQKTGRERQFELPPRPLLEPRRERATERMMQDVGFETAPIAQLVVDSDGTLMLANLQARVLLGVSQRDVGRPLKDLEVSYKPVELRSQLDQVYAERHAITVSGVEWAPGKGATMVMDVQLVPLVSADSEVFGVGISFVDVTRFRRLQEAFEESKHDTETAYEELQSTVEEMETTNEELQSTNEELETTNEELQSTNEELETMNEELSSTNEELEAINDELQQRTEELNETNIFLAAILGSFDGGVVLLDSEMRVTAWNAGARDLFGLDDGQIQGQHFLNLDIGVPVDELRPAVRDALSGNGDREPIEIETRGRNGRTMTCRVRLSPLVPDNGAARGVILFLEPTG